MGSNALGSVVVDIANAVSVTEGNGKREGKREEEERGREESEVWWWR